MQDAVDEQGGRSVDLTGGDRALDVTTHAGEHRAAGPVSVEQLDVERELGGIPPQVTFLERALAMEEQRVHGPEAPLERGGLRGGRCRKRMRVLFGHREVPEGETDAGAEPALDLLDLAEGHASVGALVVTVLEDQAAPQGPADMIDDLVERLDVAACLGGLTSPAPDLQGCPPA